jgi:lysozyme family protein
MSLAAGWRSSDRGPEAVPMDGRLQWRNPSSVPRDANGGLRQDTVAFAGATSSVGDPMHLSPALQEEYVRLFRTCVVRPTAIAHVDAAVNRLREARPRYEAVAARTSVPWAVIAVIHMLEASGRFTRHLHNGDPLTARTVQVPAGRPRIGAPPFTWEASAADALTLKGLHQQRDWSLPRTLHTLEGYNGWGYRRHHPEVLSPYLWGMCTHYRAGKYVADGRWSSTAVSSQCGCAVLLRRLAELGEVRFDDQPAATPDAPLVRYHETLPADPAEQARAADLQRWLNTHPGIFLRVDGVAGPRTSEAFRRVTGRYLPGDPRGSS